MALEKIRQTTNHQIWPKMDWCSSNDKAKDLDAQQARMELHLRSQVWRAVARMAGGSCLTFAFADLLKKFWHLDHRPRKDHQRARPLAPESSGYVVSLSFFLRRLVHERRPVHLCALWVWPAITPHWRHHGRRWQIAAPWKSGNPSATSLVMGTPRRQVKIADSHVGVTLPPASMHTR